MLLLALCLRRGDKVLDRSASVCRSAGTQHNVPNLYIPVHTGKPHYGIDWQPSLRYGLSPYTRGNRLRTGVPRTGQVQGLSPYTRGNQQERACRPLCADQGLSPYTRGNLSPHAMWRSSNARGLSPYTRGNREHVIEHVFQAHRGLSPYTRGNLWRCTRRCWNLHQLRSIPVHTGKP